MSYVAIAMLPFTSGLGYSKVVGPHELADWNVHCPNLEPKAPYDLQYMIGIFPLGILTPAM